jgi:trans-aconitate methyltransferase
MTTWNPTDYARNSSIQQTWARELIAKLKLRGDERMLDIGCGDGKVTAEIAAQIPRGSLLGIDNSPDMVGYAKASYEGGNLRFAVADASALPFGGEFDVVFSNACLHWIYDHRPVLAGIRRALRPGGRALLQMGGKGNAAGALEVATELMASPRWHRYFEGFAFRYGFHGPSEYREWLTEAGLRPVRVELIPKTMRHDGAAGLAGWIRTTWIPYTNAVPIEEREAFIEELVDQYLQRHPLSPEGEALVAMVRLEVEATG